ncbi:MAG: YciI family protein [Duganella sp.]
MEFIVLRRANQSTERGDQPPALEPGVFLRPSDSAVRLTRRDGAWVRTQGPYAPRELVAGMTLVDAASRADVIEQVRWWPLFDAGAVYEIRTPGTGRHWAGLDDPATPAEHRPERHPDLTRYLVLLRADFDARFDASSGPDAEALARIQAYHAEGVRSGALLAACGLPVADRSARVHFANANTTVVDGPFSALNELVAGYWMLQAASLEDAVAWAQAYPYPLDGGLTVEIRAVCERREQREFTPEMEAAEARLRAELLAASMGTAPGKDAAGA